MLHYVVTVFIYMFVMFYLQLLLFVFTYWFFYIIFLSVVVFIASLTTIYCSKHNHLFVHVSRNCV